MSTLDSKIMIRVKEKARAAHLTQRRVAEELRVSLPTVKRWWAGKGLTLSVLDGLCRLLGITIGQLFLEEEGASPPYTYTQDQERMLVANPKALALFDLLVSGQSVTSIQKKYALNEAILTALLLKLDRAGLIELSARNKVKLRRGGEPQWALGGPLSTAYRQKMIAALLGDHPKNETTFFIHNYLPEDHSLLNAKLQELARLMLACNERGNFNPGEATSYGFYACLKKFEWKLRGILG